MSLVPAEFVGRARAFRARLAVADARTTAAVTAIIGPLARRYQRTLGRNPRQEMLTGAARDWRVNVPETGRLSRTIALARVSLDVAEQRVSTVQFRYPRWAEGETEQGVTVQSLRLIATRERFKTGTATHAAIGLHALAWCFQRGRDRSEAAIFADLAALAVAPTTRAVSIAVPGGRWVGEMVKVRDQAGGDVPVLAVRTFLDDDLADDGPVPWRAAFEALKRDAAAPLPT